MGARDFQNSASIIALAALLSPTLMPIGFGDTPVAAAVGNLYRIDSSGGPMVVNLPQVAPGNDGATVSFTMAVDGNPVVINAFAGDNIFAPSNPSLTLTTQGDNVTLRADDTVAGWLLVT